MLRPLICATFSPQTAGRLRLVVERDPIAAPNPGSVCSLPCVAAPERAVQAFRNSIASLCDPEPGQPQDIEQ
jgi:hypothetical protein